MWSVLLYSWLVAAGHEDIPSEDGQETDENGESGTKQSPSKNYSRFTRADVRVCLLYGFCIAQFRPHSWHRVHGYVNTPVRTLSQIFYPHDILLCSDMLPDRANPLRRTWFTVLRCDFCEKHLSTHHSADFQIVRGVSAGVPFAVVTVVAGPDLRGRGGANWAVAQGLHN